MNEYPDYFPPFLQDFHAQKDFFKAFYLWRSMLDNKRELDGNANQFSSRISDMGNFMELQCLFENVLLFLHLHGWQLYRSRKKGDYSNIEETVESLRNLQQAWWSLMEDEDGLRMKDEYIIKFMTPFHNWLPYMPVEIQEKWRVLAVKGEETADV